MGVSINRLYNANMYSEGQSLLGMIEEIKLPALKAKDGDVNVMGLHASIKLPSGMEAMAGTIKFNAVYSTLFDVFGSPYDTKQIQVRCNLQTYDSGSLIGEVPVVAFLTVRFKDSLPALTVKVNDNPEQESEYNASYYRLEIDGVRMIEMDAFSNTFFVKDRDVLARYRSNLGF